jgi:hypothetical protein
VADIVINPRKCYKGIKKQEFYQRNQEFSSHPTAWWKK